MLSLLHTFVSWRWQRMYSAALCFALFAMGGALSGVAAAQSIGIETQKGAPQQDPPQSEAAKLEAAKDARARAYWQLVIDTRYADFVAAGDATMRSGFTAAACEQLWQRIQSQLGRFRRIESSHVADTPPYHGVSLTCRHERGIAVVRVVLDKEDRISGLWLDKVEPQSDPNENPPPYARRDSFTERPCVAAVITAEMSLPGTISMPNECDNCPGVVLVHGSGPHDRDETIGPNKVFRDIAWGLASRGIAVLRYEKRTKAYPNSRGADEWTLESETVDDALAAARVLRELPNVADDGVFIVGHSLGAIAAPFIAQRDEQLAGIVLLAGSTRSIVDLLEEQVAYIANADGKISDEEKLPLDLVRRAADAIRAGKPEDVPPDSGLPARYMLHMHSLDVLKAARLLELPILICQGGRDYQVPKKDFDLWKHGLEGRRNVTFELFEPLNHLFIAGEGRSTPEEYTKAGHVSEQVIEKLAEWIKARKPSRPK